VTTPDAAAQQPCRPSRPVAPTGSIRAFAALVGAGRRRRGNGAHAVRLVDRGRRLGFREVGRSSIAPREP
jgi:hypothetical protein